MFRVLGWFGVQVPPLSGCSWSRVPGHVKAHNWFGARVPPSLSTAGLGCTAGSGHGSLQAWLQLHQGADSSWFRIREGCGSFPVHDCNRMRVSPGSGLEQDAGPSWFGVQPVWDAGSSLFRTRAGCGFLVVQDWGRMWVSPSSGLEQDAGLSQFRVQAVQDADPSLFRTRVGCRFLPVEDRSGMRVPPRSGPERDEGCGMRVPLG